ncbi:MAG TPA: glycoside hydrolase family 9 protein, partial [Verrucomicrobiae bacterium]|nr:glycoside hydrolase family 9 protein [Verrucomicrobiae bacterium]
SGYRNFAPFFGAANITNLNKVYSDAKGVWIPHLAANDYLWAYGCGAGSYLTIGGLGNSGQYNDGSTVEMVNNDVRAVFTLLFGSWFGDWDHEDNVLRSILATPTYGLASAWSGRPHWFAHPMALGEPIGYTARLTQNNGSGGLYRNQYNDSAAGIFVALMGDPTLRLHPVMPPSGLNGAANAGGITLTWTPSPDSVLGYHVYRAASPLGPYSRLSTSPVSAASFTDTTGGSGPRTFMVRAVKLETAASGSYTNASQGVFWSIDGGPSTPADTTLPTVALSALGSTVSGTSVALGATSSDNVGVVGVQFKIDGANLGSEDTTSPFSTVWNTTSTANGQHTLTAVARDAAGNQAISTPLIVTVENGNTATNPPAGTNLAGTATIWFDDALPVGATAGSSGAESWRWVTQPAPFSGGVAHQSILASGLHEHYFNWANPTFVPNSDDVLFTYVYLDPANPPTEIMLSWNADNWEHRAYWGADQINYGTPGSNGRRYIGPLPAAGQWTRLEVPAEQVGLGGLALVGMGFTAFNGRVTWDVTGKMTAGSSTPQDPDPGTPPSTNTTIAVAMDASIVDYTGLTMPKPGDHTLHILSPTLLELRRINAKQPDPAPVDSWDFVDSSSQFHGPALSEFSVVANGQTIAVQSVGFKRRPLYAPLVVRDLRIDNCLLLKLASPIANGQTVEVKNPSGAVWPAHMQFTAVADPLRYSPIIHVNQEGYGPALAKKARLGYFLGNLGEMDLSGFSTFRLVDARTGAQVHQGTLTPRSDVGYYSNPRPYQSVYEADFSAFSIPGTYRVAVPGLGASMPFTIDDGVAMAFERTYALGLYHQRCGTNNTAPFTRHHHDSCHLAPAVLPSPQSSFAFTWGVIAAESADFATNPRHTARRLKDEASMLYPFINRGPIEVSGGHHDAGDYSKYTINSAGLVHYLMFTVDTIPGAGTLDNLGLPESGDGISDLMQEAKWEADFLAKMQDADGGFYFLVYPRDRRYENNVTPDHGDPQIVWPKNTAVTAAAVGALAQCASSPTFRRRYPAEAALYMEKAQLGWKFLTNAIARYGKDGSYQKITTYGDEFMHDDELAWAACEMFLATGNPAYHQKLSEWFPDPQDPGTRRWGWWRLWQSYGYAIRSYAFAARSGRLPKEQLNAAYLSKCEAEITAAANDALSWSRDNAYGTSFPLPTKAISRAGWYFSSDHSSDMAAAYQLNPRREYLDALVANADYEAGCNPVNVTYLTGLGWKRQREIVHQYAQNDRRVL